MAYVGVKPDAVINMGHPIGPGGIEVRPHSTATITRWYMLCPPGRKPSSRSMGGRFDASGLGAEALMVPVAPVQGAVDEEPQ
jgi:hypothetical protein